MKKILLWAIACLLCMVYLYAASTPPAMAMSKHPREKRRGKSSGFVTPEIEIINRPEIVFPTEVLPAVGKDSTAIAKKIRTKDIQNALKKAGFDPGSIDGKIGSQTKKAIRGFQKANLLNIDGIVGNKTWKILKPFLTVENANQKN